VAAIHEIRWTFLLGGHGLPIMLLAIAGLKPGLNTVLVPAAGLIAALAGWLSKAVIITRAAHTHGFAIPSIPIRGREIGSPAGKQGW
jgi:phenylacetyl-CoA:acceptor oxidoreductase subunit 2